MGLKRAILRYVNDQDMQDVCKYVFYSFYSSTTADQSKSGFEC